MRLHYFDIPNGWEVVVEYTAAYLFGLFIFQALFMRSMYPNYVAAVRGTLFAETVSMNMVMAGMFPVIVAIKYHYPLASDPFLPYFWGMMSLATIVGALFAYPINAWMVGKGVKHGMMSQRIEMHHEVAPLPKKQALFLIIATYLFFFFVLALISLFAPIRFT